MATPSSILAWEIPWREEPGGLQKKKKKKEPIDIKGHPCGCRSKSACLTETGQAQSTEMHSTHPHGSRCSPANTVFLC